MQPGPDTFQFRGLNFGATNRPDCARWLLRRSQQGPAGFVCITGAHGVIEAQSNPAFFATLNNSAMMTPDGTPLTWFAWIIGKRQVGRVSGWELMTDSMELDRGFGTMRHFFLGAKEEVTTPLVRNLQKRFPKLQVCGVNHPPFRPMTDEEVADAAAQIRTSGANVIWVGISTPRQEMLSERLAACLDGGVLIACGAAFDQMAGLKPIAPTIVTRMGLEWLFRLLSDPRRLWSRYSEIVPKFARLFVLELFASRRMKSSGR
jgi:N-acetylglucosaminyldiphosphoundecaprenol N-acetyl-beta-D-mannosaminyltransferase